MTMTNFTDDWIDPRVQRGAEWLDEHGPAEWWERINTRTLNIMDAHNCVLGQVFAAEANEAGFSNGYIYATETMRVRADEHGYMWPRMRGREHQYGFCGSDDELENAWVNFILKRRALVNA